ncbi:hypothetical protein [Paenibacillus tuaregi]
MFTVLIAYIPQYTRVYRNKNTVSSTATAQEHC